MSIGRVMKVVRCWLILLILVSGVPGVALSAEPGPSSSVVLRVSTPRYTWDAEGLRVPGYAVHDAPGAPALPVWATWVELPATGAWTIAYESRGQQELSAPDVILPVPQPQVALDAPLSPQEVADRVAAAPAVPQPDPAIYAVNAFYPASVVQAGPEQWQRGRRLLAVRVFPFQYNPVTGRLLYHADVEVRVTTEVVTTKGGAFVLGGGDFSRPVTTEVVTTKGGAPALGSGDFSRPALRIYTAQRGMYRLTYADLAGAGVPVDSVDPATFAMTYLDEPIAIEVVGEEDGRFDPGDLVIFYAVPYQGRYMNRNVYRFTWGGEPGARMAQRDAAPAGAGQTVTTIARTLHVEYDRSYYSTYNLPPDADHWFDDPLYANVAAPAVTRTYPLNLAEPLAEGDLLVRAQLHGGKDRGVDPDQSVAIALNGQPVGLFQWQGSRLLLAEATVPAAWLQPADNRLTLIAALEQLPGMDAYWVSPDWVQVRYPVRAVAEDDRLYIESVILPQRAVHRVYLPLISGGGGGQGTTFYPYRLVAEGFSAPAVRIYDVRDARSPARLVAFSAKDTGTAYAVEFGVPHTGGSYFLAADGGLLAPLAVEPDAPSSWRSAEHTADYIAIVHRSLWDAVQPLLDHRAAEGLRVAKVDVQDIYDEFSAGRVDPQAIRSFLTYAYHHWNAGQAQPQYVLLVGDGHYDFKGASRPDLPNLIPPYLLHIDPYIGETAADNRYACVDGPDDFLPDMAIGRIPARTPAEVSAVVNKILAYETVAPAGEWQRRVVFVADDKDDQAGNFHSLSDQTRLGVLPESYDGRTIYYRSDATTDTAAKMKQAIRSAFNAQAVYLQWFGHASRQRWGGGLLNMFDVLDPPLLASNTVLPFTAHYSCWSGYFINVQGSATYGGSEMTLGEKLLLTPGRGAVADFSPSGLHIGSALVALNRGVVRALFVDRTERIGIAVNAAKLEVFATSNAALDLIDTQVLFGDPATRLRLP